ncbi:MAG TPA: endonuclease/exonuclease/phosphatase family protein [Acidimicrobiales bacterium]
MPAIDLVRRIAVWTAWGLTAAVGVFVVARLVGLTDRLSILFAAATLTIWFVVPCLVALVAGAVLRTYALVAVDVVLIVVLLVWAAPDLRWWSTPAEVNGPTTVVASANIAAPNPNLERAAQDLLAIDADVMNVLELTPAGQDALRAAGVAERYPYRVENPRVGVFGSAIYSRFPLRDTGVLELAGARMARATVELPSGPTTVIAVHTTQPLVDVDALEDQLDALRSTVEAIEGPVILAGDFNATRQHQPFRELLEAGFTDAHLATGRGWTATWPAGSRLPPFALIDHVLVSDDLAVAMVKDVSITSSDHRAVVATIGRSAP